MGPRLSLSKAYTILLQMQSHGLGMTPVSIKHLRATLQQKSIKTQRAVSNKTGRQSQIQWCKLKVVTNKHEDFNLVFANHGKEDGIYPTRTEIPSKEIAKAQNKDQ
jgi:hypothetical protein